jgi:hypothetical protein
MPNIFSVSAAPRGAGFDVVTAAMLSGGASGGWSMAQALKSRASHCPHERRRVETTAPRRKPLSEGRGEQRRG